MYSVTSSSIVTSKALAILFSLVDKVKKGDKIAANTLVYLGSVLGFDFSRIELSETELKEKIKKISEELNETLINMEEIIEYRKNARINKNWELAYKIREAFDKAGLALKDSKEGTVWEIK